MSETQIKLTTEEMIELDKLFRKSKRGAIRFAAGVAIVILIGTIIPKGIVGLFARDTTATYDPNPGQSFFQQWGFSTWLIVYIITIAVFTFLIFLSKKILLLKKDLKEGEKLEMEVVVISKYADDKNETYFMRVNSDTLKNKKIILEKEQFNQFKEGQKLTIDVYKNSMILLSNRI